MRSSRFQLQSLARRWSVRRPSYTTIMVAISVGFAVAHWTAYALTGQRPFTQDALVELLGISRTTVHQGTEWQFLSYMLLHANPIHLIANMLPLYLAGREVEPIMGRRHFFGLYLLANLVGGFVQWGAMAGGYVQPDVVVGVSAGVAAVIAAFATILPELEVTGSLLFLLPLRIRAKRFGVLVILLAAGLWASSTGTAVGPVAILVGTLIGWAYVKQLGFGNPMAIERFFLERRQDALRLERMPAEQYIVEEIDPILEKLGRCGLRGLSRAEKRALQRGSAKLAERK